VWLSKRLKSVVGKCLNSSLRVCSISQGAQKNPIKVVAPDFILLSA
jgi:hypothetical protein